MKEIIAPVDSPGTGYEKRWPNIFFGIVCFVGGTRQQISLARSSSQWAKHQRHRGAMLAGRTVASRIDTFKTSLAITKFFLAKLRVQLFYGNAARL